MEEGALAKAISAAQKGDAAAFERIVEHFAGRVFGFLYRMTGSRSDAEDLMQEVFVRLVRTLSGYQHDGRFEAWLFRIAANLARDRLRRAKRTPKQVSAEGDWAAEEEGGADWLTAIGSQADSPDAGLIRAEELDALGRALAALPETERTVIMLRHFSHMSFKEIADATGTPLGTALARGHRGLARLRELMGGSESRAAGALQEE